MTGNVTQVYWQPLSALLNPTSPDKEQLVQTLSGFDDEFRDIVDYIIRITHRIWEQKNFGLCERYYSEYCPVHTLGGYSDDVDTVIRNTLKTVAAFPDRSLIGENVIWRKLGLTTSHSSSQPVKPSSDGEITYYSSHRITSIMTNKGASEFGAATGKTGRVTTIADCICRGNQIVYEWLMRDNSFLLKQLGIDVITAAENMAENMVKAPQYSVFQQWHDEEFSRVREQQATSHVWPEALDSKAVSSKALNSEAVKSSALALAQNWLQQIFNLKSLSACREFYACDAQVQWPGGRQATGIAGVSGMIIQWLAQCADALTTCDHVAVTDFDEHTQDIAIRWSLAGTFQAQQPELARYSGLPFFILGATHLRVTNGKIQNEWTVFDEVAAIANLIRQANIVSQENIVSQAQAEEK